MLHDNSDQLPISHDSLHLLRDSLLLEDPLLLSFDGDADIDRTSFRSDDLYVERLLREVDLTAVGTVDENGGDSAENLDGERGRGGNRQGRNSRFEE